LKLIVNYIYIYILASTRRGLNIIESDFDWIEYIGYFISGHSIQRVLRLRITTFFWPGDCFLLNLIVNYIYILALIRLGINIIESDFDWNEYIWFFMPGDSI
jgi:hypothetical protein